MTTIQPNYNVLYHQNRSSNYFKRKIEIHILGEETFKFHKCSNCKRRWNTVEVFYRRHNFFLAKVQNFM